MKDIKKGSEKNKKINHRIVPNMFGDRVCVSCNKLLWSWAMIIFSPVTAAFIAFP